MTDYEHTDWVPWYTPDTAGWLTLSLAARGAMAEIVRKVDRRGLLALRRGLPSLAILLRVTWEGELEPAVRELIAAGKIEWDEDAGLLRDPDYLARRRRGSAERTADWRARKRHGDVGDVTRVTPVTCDVDEMRSDEIRSEHPSGVIAPAREGATPVAGESLTDARRAMADALTAPSGVALDVDLEWAGYLADRERKGKPHTDGDWKYWLANAVKFAKRDRVREADRKADAEARRVGPPPPPKPTPAQEAAFARELVGRVLGGKR